MNNRPWSFTRLGFAAALTVLGACSPGSVAVTEPTPTSSSDEPGHIPYDARRAAATTAQAVSAAQKATTYVMADAYSWIPPQGCAACHRGGAVLMGQAIATHNGLTVNTSASNGMNWLASYMSAEQQAAGQWTHGGSYELSKSSWGIAGMAMYTAFSGSSTYSSNVKRAVDWFRVRTTNTTLPAGAPFAGQVRLYNDEDHYSPPVNPGWPKVNALVVSGVAQALTNPALTAAERTTYTTYMNSLTDSLEGWATYYAARNDNTWGTELLSYSLAGMAYAGRTPANNANAATIRNRILALGGGAGNGWGDPQYGYGVNALDTGFALWALCTAGVGLATNAVIQNGIDYLFNTEVVSGANGYWNALGMTVDVPTTFAALGLSCYGALNVTVTTSNINPVDPGNAAQAKIAPASPNTQTVSFNVNIQNTGLVTNTFTFNANAGLGANVSVNPASVTIGANGSGSATVTAVFPAGLPASAQAPISVVTSYTGAQGLVNDSKTVNVTIGNAPDANASGTAVTFTAGAGGTVTAGNSITFSTQVKNGATLLSNGAVLGAVTYYYGNTTIATVTTTNGTFSYNWTVPVALQGNQTITASYSGVGAPAAIQYAASSAQTNITVNALPAPPAPTVTGPASGTTTNSGNVTVTGASQAGAIVTIKDANGANLGSVTVPVGGSYSVPLNLPPGAYTITVIATNAAGNSPPSSSITVTVVPPAPVVLGPANGTLTPNGTVTLNGTGYPGGTVTIKDGATTVGTFTIDANGNWSGNVSLGAGAHNLSITQTVSGATNANPVSLSVGIVPAAPSISSPVANAGLPNGNNVVTGTATAGTTVTIYDNGVQVGSGVAAANNTFNVTVPLFYGNHTLTATASNSAGPSAASAGIAVRVAPNAPTITSPAAATVEQIGPFTFAGTAVAGATVTIYDNGVQVTTVVAAANGSFSYTFNAPSLGAHNVTATQTAGGLTSPASAAKTITVHKDSDGDGVYDEVDNCSNVWNFDQVDRDGDGLGDVCDQAPGQKDSTNQTTSNTDLAVTTFGDAGADDTLLARNENNLVTLLGGAWAQRNTLTLVVDTAANPTGNIQLYGKPLPSAPTWTLMTTYDLQLGPTHPVVLANGLQAQVNVVTPRTSLANYAFRYRQVQARVKEADGSITTIPSCNTGTVSANDSRCVSVSNAYQIVEGTNVDQGVKFTFTMKAL